MANSFRRAVSLYDRCDVSGALQRSGLTQARWHSWGQACSVRSAALSARPPAGPPPSRMDRLWAGGLGHAQTFVAASIEGVRLQRAHCGLLAPWPTVPAAIHTYPVWSSWPQAARSSAARSTHFVRHDVLAPLGRAVRAVYVAVAEDRLETAVREWAGTAGHHAARLGALLVSPAFYQQAGAAAWAGVRKGLSRESIGAVVRGILGPHGISILLGCILEGVVGRGRFVPPTELPEGFEAFDDRSVASLYVEAQDHASLGRADDASYGLVGRVVEKQLVLAAIEALSSGEIRLAVTLIRIATLARVLMQPIRVVSCLLVGLNAVLCGVVGMTTFWVIRAADVVCTHLSPKLANFTNRATTTLRARIDTLTCPHPSLHFPMVSSQSGSEQSTPTVAYHADTPTEIASNSVSESLWGTPSPLRESPANLGAEPRDFALWIARPHGASELQRARELAEQERQERLAAHARAHNEEDSYSYSVDESLDGSDVFFERGSSSDEDVRQGSGAERRVRIIALSPPTRPRQFHQLAEVVSADELSSDNDE